ncbi:MAG: malonate--CoA ligase [Kiloniellales bacterium]
MSDNLYAIIAGHFPAERSTRVMELENDRSLSYGHLEAESGRIARLLVDIGVVAGDRVAVQSEKSPQAVFLYLACLRVGAVYLPLNTAYTASEIAYFLGDAEPKVFVCRPESEADLVPLARTAGVARVLTLGADGAGSLTATSCGLAPLEGAVARAKDDVAALLYTSGTTGRSKGAMLTHGNLASNGLTLVGAWGFTANDCLLHALPIFHTHGLFVAIHCVLLSGSRMIFLPRFDAKTVLDLLPRATVMMGVPTFYTRLLAEPKFDAGVAGKLRLFISGSAPLLEETFQHFEARTGQRILERYGMTEIGMHCSNPLKGERIAGMVGPPLPGCEVRIADEEGYALPQGEIGTIEVRGPNVFSGYWRQPEKTAAEFRTDGFFITGDLGRLTDKGYVQIAGRAKDLIISGGFNVYPKEVELCIDQIPGVEESAVIGLPHPDFGEAVSAVVKCARGGSNGISVDTILAVAKRALANYKVPKRIFFVEELPRNAMGKVQKNELRERFKGTFLPRT